MWVGKFVLCTLTCESFSFIFRYPKYLEHLNSKTMNPHTLAKSSHFSSKSFDTFLKSTNITYMHNYRTSNLNSCYAHTDFHLISNTYYIQIVYFQYLATVCPNIEKFSNDSKIAISNSLFQSRIESPNMMYCQGLNTFLKIQQLCL